MSEKQDTVYIAGPMRGIPFYNFPAFFEAEKAWKAAGWGVVNPARNDVELDGFDPRGKKEFATGVACHNPTVVRTSSYYMSRDLPYLTGGWLRQCNGFMEKIAQVTAIAVLPGWEKSEGACLEVRVARHCGLVVCYAEDPLIMGVDASPQVCKFVDDDVLFRYVPNAKERQYQLEVISKETGAKHVWDKDGNLAHVGPVGVEGPRELVNGYQPVVSSIPNPPPPPPPKGGTGQSPSKRVFSTGATRDTDEGKLDFDGFLSHAVLVRFGEYMHKHRKMADGSLRDSDNWQKGIPRDQYRKSAWRHFLDWWNLHRTGQDVEEAACALLFNVMGDLHEVLKGNRRQ